MRKFAAIAALIGLAWLPAGCRTETVCPAIAQAPVVALTVSREFAPSVKTIRLKACQAGRCAEAELELMPGSTTVDQGCEPGPYGGDRPCSATSSPDGTLTGMLMLGALSDAPVEATATGTGATGLPLAARTVTFTPRVDFPYGRQCGRFITAGVVLDADGLRQAP